MDSTLKEKHKPVPNSTISILRSGLFSNVESLQTSWTKIELKRGKFREHHQDLIDAIICISGDEIKTNKNGEMWFIIDFYALDKFLGGSRNYDLLESKFLDLQTTLIALTKIIKNDDNEYKLMDYQTIITSYKTIEKIKTNHGGGPAVSRIKKTVGVVFSKAYTELLLQKNTDIKIFYSSLVPKILSLKKQNLKAITRLLLTQKNDQIMSKLKICEFLNIKTNSREFRRFWSDVNASKTKLEELGISVNTDRLEYKRNKNVFFLN